MKKLLVMYRRMPVAARAAIWFMICTMMQKCVSFITIPIFTRLMSSEEFGMYSAYLSVLNVLTVLCTMNLESCVYINSITREEDKKKHDEIAINYITLGFATTIVLLLLYLVFSEWINTLLGLTTPMMLVAFFEILWILPVRFWSYQQRFAYRYIKMVILTFSITFLNAVLGIVLVKIASEPYQALARACSVGLVQFCFGFSIYLGFAIRSKRLLYAKKWGEAFKLHLPLLPHGLSMSLLFTSDRIMINRMVGSVATAMFSVANSAGLVVQMVQTSIVDAMRPWIYEKLKKRENSDMSSIMNMLIILVAAISVGYSLLAPEIVSIMAPAEYASAVYVTPPIAGSSFFMFMYHMFVVVETYFEKTKKIMYASVTAALLDIVLNAITIPLFGYIAAAYTTMVSYAVLSFMHYRNVRAIELNELNGIRMFDAKRMVIITVVASIAIVAVTLTYVHFAVRLLVGFAGISCALIFRRELIALVKLMKKK